MCKIMYNTSSHVNNLFNFFLFQSMELNVCIKKTLVKV